jgi:5-(carboxyamino)imidazole ribonucleotide mutase
VFIAAAGLAAHLAGTVAGLTVKPVIGVPMEGGPLSGQDALLSTVMMPGGIPVATVAIGKAGAKNAAYLAAQMIALSDDALAQRLTKDREDNAKAIADKDAELQKSI